MPPENRRTLNARLLVESGRFLTAQAGTYFLPVVDKKISRGTTYVVLENCLNGFQKPALEAMLRQAAGGGPLTPQEPLFTGENAFPITALGDPARTETVELVGNLCCGTDVLCHGFTGPALEVGDLVAVGNTGRMPARCRRCCSPATTGRRSCWWTRRGIFFPENCINQRPRRAAGRAWEKTAW